MALTLLAFIFFVIAILGPVLIVRLFSGHAASMIERSVLLGVSVACGFGQGLFLYIVFYGVVSGHLIDGVIGGFIQSLVFTVIAIPCIGLPISIVAITARKATERAYLQGVIGTVFGLAEITGVLLGIIAGIAGLKLPII